ncbi:iron(III) hydroxamate ABC transporter ATP binding subunit [Paraburkholderia unamae]|uniref:ATP-binding cassette domain-containing protein n=1 Tax=Paraburkholderia unamae TaxID=219649 RepID=UPI001CB58053|nr:ATP-binding cassette domain-containing protein [Paraburkholderia unamae]CAG9265229.1 iron(III) hydroxamate ABC transporter ATP binding subunit [Paraburkholderia unamae]
MPSRQTSRTACARGADKPLYTIDGLFVEAGERTLLADVSLQLARGRVCGLIGHNGSGKTTLLRVLARQQAATRGAVRFRGRTLDAWDARAFAREVAYLPQHPPAADGMTVGELVALGRYPWHGALGRFSASDAQRVEEAMALTDVRRFAHRHVDQLSGGERQRAWLAMLVAQDSDCLLLDEPISALDVAHQLEVLGLVRRLSQARGLGVVVVLHDINMAARFCDELIALYSGRVLVRGTPAEICRPDVLKSIYGVPMDTFVNPRGGVPVCTPR